MVPFDRSIALALFLSLHSFPHSFRYNDDRTRCAQRPILLHKLNLHESRLAHMHEHFFAFSRVSRSFIHCNLSPTQLQRETVWADGR